jgi:large subunit ribosomal protein L18
MSVFRSRQHVYAQVVDDESSRTLAAASSRDKDLAGAIGYGGNIAAAKVVGKAVAERASAAGIKAVAFDRGANKYHGRVAALAEAAREAGLDF